jgi:hypothetical protein
VDPERAALAPDPRAGQTAHRAERYRARPRDVRPARRDYERPAHDRGLRSRPHESVFVYVRPRRASPLVRQLDEHVAHHKKKKNAKKEKAKNENEETKKKRRINEETEKRRNENENEKEKKKKVTGKK